jgi:cullin 3
MGLFRDLILRAPIPSYDDLTIMTLLNTVILDHIQMEREGDIIDTSLIRACVYMLEGLYESEDEDESTKLYLTVFEPAFLAASETFYESESASLLAQADAGTFCRQAKRRSEEEQDRCRSTLSILSSSKIKVVFEEKFIKHNIREVITMEGSGVKYMLKTDRMSELEMVYDLIARVDPRKEELKLAVQERIVELGTELNNAATNMASASIDKGLKQEGETGDVEAKAPASKAISQQTVAAIKWVDDILQLKEKFDHVLASAFKSDQGLQTAFTRSFTDFINAFQRSSEYLSLFFDENMKKGIKGKTENEVDALLDKGIILLRYIQDKDMFERYYKKHLSRRLLMKRSISMDAERQMISKMKMEVGNSFTQKIESMFKDMAVSEDLSSSYKQEVAALGDPDPHRPELEINVLTSTMWPLETMSASSKEGGPNSSCIFPSQVEILKQGFEKFYLKKHTGRQLAWQAHMGSADLRAYFPEMKGKKTRELNVSTYAMIILLLFNDLGPGQSYTCEEIQAKTNIPWNELTRNLQSLAVAPKTRILLKEPMSKDIKPDDKFIINEKFYTQFQKIKIGVVSSGNKVEDVDERKETEKKNDLSRGGSIEAAIVRIMK